MSMDGSFEYTYSAPDQEEVRRIRSKYLPKEEESKMERLRRLDREAERPGMVASLSMGILGALIFGAGMSLCLVWALYLPGILLGLIGGVLMAAAYPVYSHVTRRQREKIAPEILKLTEELS